VEDHPSYPKKNLYIGDDSFEPIMKQDSWYFNNGGKSRVPYYFGLLMEGWSRDFLDV
jgi:hypothetical protein